MKKILTIMFSLLLITLISGCSTKKYSISFVVNGNPIPSLTQEVASGSTLVLDERLNKIISYEIHNEKENTTYYELKEYAKIKVNGNEIDNIEEYEFNEDSTIEIDCVNKQYFIYGKHKSAEIFEPNRISEMSEKEYEILEIPEMYGRNFYGWVLEDSFGSDEFKESDNVSIITNELYIADMDIKVTYYADNEIIDEKLIRNGDKVPEIELGDNYAFFGWTEERNKDNFGLEYNDVFDCYILNPLSEYDRFDFSNETIERDSDLYACAFKCDGIKVVFESATSLGRNIRPIGKIEVLLDDYLRFPVNDYLLLSPSNKFVKLDIFNKDVFEFTSEDPEMFEYEFDGSFAHFVGKKLGSTNVTMNFGGKTFTFPVDVVDEKNKGVDIVNQGAGKPQ